MTAQARLVEVLGSLSLACDAADGFPHETTLRSTVLAARLASLHRPDDDHLRADVVVGSLIRHLGCTGFAVEEAHRYGAGDDVALRALMAEVDFSRPDVAVDAIGARLAAHAPVAARAEAVGALLGDGPVAEARHHAAQCDAAERLARLLPVSARAAEVASDAFERWDGLGGPRGLAGDAISPVARIVEVAYVAELFRGRQGRGGATAELRARSGGQLDPEVVTTMLSSAGELFDLVEDPATPVWDLLLAAEPPPYARITEAQLQRAATAFAWFADLKSSWLTGHSEAVADLVGAAATATDGVDARPADLRLAGLLHDIGRVGIPTGIWDAPRRLGRHELDRVRFHSWETHRVLSATPLFAPVVDVAGAAHERCDGSGYHRALDRRATPAAAALLAAADVWCALRADRPHRPALDPNAARAVMAGAVTEGLLERRCVDAVLQAAAEAPLARATWPRGLTDREVEVLRSLAGGATSKEAARDLGITAKTVSHHVAHIYDKIGVRSRAGATLFALEHGLLTT